MARLKSRVESKPAEMSDGWFRYLEGLDRRIPARTDLAASPTTTEIATAINDLYADLREAGLMERS